MALLSERLGFTCVVRRERLIRLGSRAGVLANSRRVRVTAQLLLLAGLVFVLLRLGSIWRESDITVGQVRWGYLVGAVAIAAAAIMASSFVWLSILDRLGVAPRAAWAGIFLQAQVAKYVPGGLWQYASRAALAQSHGIALRAAAKSLPIEVASAAAAAAAFSMLLVGWWGFAGLVVVFGALAIAERKSGGNRVALRAGLRATLLYGVVSGLVGVSFWMTARAFVPVSAADIAYYIGAFATAWLVGLVAIYAPGGVGVREAVLVGLLRGKIGSADALVVAAASRGVLTFVDLVGATIGLAVLRRRRQPAGPLDQPRAH
jgi:glycosyltransferase 2 family protein